MDQQKIFFSYSRQDASEFALKLYNDLKNAGADVWIDQKNIKAGANWDVEIGKALEVCQYVLFIVSEKAVQSDHVLDEVYYAKDARKQVFPILYSSCPVPYRLYRLQQIDFTSDYNMAFERLIVALDINKQAKLPFEKPVESSKKITLNDSNSNENVLRLGDNYFNRKFYKKAADTYLLYSRRLNADQYYNLGWMYYSGSGITKDNIKALYWFKKAANKANSNAMYYIGNMFFDGEYVMQNFEKALRWYKQAAQKGSNDAMNRLGTMYEYGYGLKKDRTKAIECYKKAREI